ncbi:MAG: hypothetical protein JRC92_04800 [Deltaproteobacteria bacterium]|nr:hypothetical protein [Deltaproteobacteria bacterium]
MAYCQFGTPKVGAFECQGGPCQSWSGGRCEGEGSVTFTYPPVDLGDVSFFTPLGNMTAGGHILPTNHTYFSFTTQEQVYPPPYRVIAPADGRLVMVCRLEFTNSSPDQSWTTGSYNLYIEHSCTFYSYFINVNELSSRIQAALGQELAVGEYKYLRLEISAGEILAWAGSWRAVDFGVVDTARENYFVVPEHYGSHETLYIQSPFDYYGEPLKSQLEAIGPRTAEPLGGKNHYDIDGRLAGNWFLDGCGTYQGCEGRPYYYAHLAFVYDNMLPQWLAFSFSEAFPLDGQYGIRNNQPDPAEVSPESGLIKYDLANCFRYSPSPQNGSSDPLHYDPNDSPVLGALLVQMLDGRSIKVEQFPGMTADEVGGFTEGALVFGR